MGRPLKTKTIFVQRKNKNSTNYCFILYILLSGDVHYNPGPIKYPCTYCKKPTKWNQKALQCDFCDDWTHLKCTSLSLNEYKTLSRSDDCYFCHLCEDRLPKFTESYFQVSCIFKSHDLFNLKVNCINAMIQEHYHNVENVHIANSNILSRNSIISQRFIKSDGRHLSEEGVKVLASNLRLVVEGILELTNSDTKNNNVHKKEGYQYNRSDTDNSYYDEHRYYPKRNRYNHGSEERWGDNYNYRYKYSDNREWSEGNSLHQRRQ